MLNKKLSFLAILAAVLFAACGDSSTERIVDDRLVVTNVAELPACDVSNEGEQILVKDEGSVRVCADNKWFSSVGDTLYEQSGKLLCKTEKLTDSSGIKIICNGDSVGVVYNGADGAKGLQDSRDLRDLRVCRGRMVQKGLKAKREATEWKGMLVRMVLVVHLRRSMNCLCESTAVKIP